METEGEGEAPAGYYDWWTATGVSQWYFDSPRASIEEATWYVEGAMIGCPQTDAKLISANDKLYGALHDDNWDMKDPYFGWDSGQFLNDKEGPSVYRAMTSAMRGIGSTCGGDCSPTTLYYCELAQSQLVISAWSAADNMMYAAQGYMYYDTYIYDKLYQAEDAEGKAYNFYMEGNYIKTIAYLKNAWNYAGLAYEKGVELYDIEAYEDSLYYVDMAMLELVEAEVDAEADDQDAALAHADAANDHVEDSHESIMDVMLDYWWTKYYRESEAAINAMLNLANTFSWLKDAMYDIIVKMKLNLAEMLIGHNFGNFQVSISYNPSLGAGVDGETSAVDSNGDGVYEGATIEIGPEAFDGQDNKGFSEPWLLSTVLHEKVHAMQAHEGRWYTDTNGAAVNELEAYDSEMRNAGKTGLNKAEKEDTDKRRDGYHDDMTANKDKYNDTDNDGTMDVNEDASPANNNPNYTYPP